MPRFTGSLKSYPARASFIWYFAFIAVGAAVLAQPWCHARKDAPLTVMDAIFTSTSAVCVTGLTVRSTGHDLSWFGQAFVLFLIQVGGIGIMTITSYATFQFGGRVSLRQRALVMGVAGGEAGKDLLWVLRRVILITFTFEAVGCILLFIRNLFHQPPAVALWHALFHSVSAFCNAGFALFDDSLVVYQSDPLVNFTVAALIISGGIGFPVMLDLVHNWHGTWRQFWDRLHVHTKLMLIGTAGLLAFGAVAFLIIEWDRALKDMSWGTKILASAFHSVTCRTAGFNTIDMRELTNASLFITILLMMIGAGPCSTAGGFKVSTFMALVLRGWSTYRGYVKVNVFRRTIPFETTERATATALLFAIVAIAALTSLLVIEQAEVAYTQSQNVFLEALFEVFSALGTVGLSTGITPDLSDAGRIIIIGLMFIGRLGPISVSVALSRTERRQPFQYPTEEPLIG